MPNVTVQIPFLYRPSLTLLMLTDPLSIWICRYLKSILRNLRRRASVTTLWRCTSWWTKWWTSVSLRQLTAKSYRSKEPVLRPVRVVHPVISAWSRVNHDNKCSLWSCGSWLFCLWQHLVWLCVLALLAHIKVGHSSGLIRLVFLSLTGHKCCTPGWF